MALPQTSNPAAPADSDSPSQGASQIRGVKQYLVDVFGVPNNSAVTATMGTLTTGGVFTFSQSPLTVPTLMQGTASQVLRIGSQYSNIGFEINAATVMNLNATGMLMQTPWLEWPSGVTSFLGTQGNQPLAIRTNAANRLTVAGGGNIGVGTAVPTTLLHTAGTAYSTTLDANTLNVFGVGPHAIGGATSAFDQLGIKGSFTPSTSGGSVIDVASAITLGAGFSFGQIVMAGSIVTAASGISTTIAGLQFSNAVTVTLGSTVTDWAAILINAVTPTVNGTLTNASGIKVSAPSGATNNYALWVAGGSIRSDGTFLAADGTAGGPSIAFVNNSGMGFYRPANQILGFVTSAIERMRLTDAGILLLGTTVTTSALAGDEVLAYAGSLRSVNAAGTDTARVISLRTVGATTNVVSIATGGQDIGWGTALVALGGGAQLTLGTIGGAGPATAAQNSWMRVIDSTGASFWVPAWK